MKKIILICFAFLSVLLVGCEKNSSEDDSKATYTLEVSSPTAKVGEKITLTISGEGVNEMVWLACYTYKADGTGNCLITPFSDGKLVVSTDKFNVGEYTFYATSGDFKSSTVTVNISE